VKSFLELVRYIFTIPGVKMFLSERLSQDPLENFFGCQRQRRGAHENPNVSEFCKNTNALRVINSVCGNVSKGNCRGNKEVLDIQAESRPLRKRCRPKAGKRTVFSKLIKPPKLFKKKIKGRALCKGSKQVQRLAATKSEIGNVADKIAASKRVEESERELDVSLSLNAAVMSQEGIDPPHDTFSVEMSVGEYNGEVCESPITASLLSDESDQRKPDFIKTGLFDATFMPCDQQRISDVLAPGPSEDIVSTCGSIVLKRCDIQTLNDSNWLNDQVRTIAIVSICINFFFLLGSQCIFEAHLNGLQGCVCLQHLFLSKAYE